jgi:hypothetical protein
MKTTGYPAIRLTDLSTIVHVYQGYFRPDETVMCALIVQFAGTYRTGSAGNADARYMTAVASAGFEAWQPQGLVFDLRELKYEWGDRIERLIGFGRGKGSTLEAMLMGKERELKDTDIPVAIVTSALCRVGLEGLIRGEMGQDPRIWLFDSVEDALLAIEKSQI